MALLCSVDSVLMCFWPSEAICSISFSVQLERESGIVSALYF